MPKFFYIKNENEERVFFIPDYYIDSNSNVIDFSKNLHIEAAKLAQFVGKSVSEVKSSYITQSSRYKYCRVFWVDVKEKPIGEVFDLTGENNWSMSKWCTN